DPFTHDRTHLTSKSYIFLPLNNAFGSTETNPHQQPTGTHWSLLALDLPHKHAHYYDSLSVSCPSRSNTAFLTALGVLTILRQNIAE
ncbi:hypothetical protein T440DRAFT_368815, partial [Plenodomus tracheiphilus IPT5]